MNKRSLQGYSWEDGRLRHVLARSVVIFVHMCSEERKTAMDIDKPHAHAERQTTFILAKLMCLMPLVRTFGRSFKMPVEPAMQHCTRIRSSTSKTPTREVALSHVGGETLSTERRRRSRRNAFEAQKCILLKRPNLLEEDHVANRHCSCMASRKLGHSCASNYSHEIIFSEDNREETQMIE